jgi:RHS repeat-associated protein
VSVNKQIFYQGMHGDENGSGGTRPPVQMTKSWTTSSEPVGVIYDQDWLQGALFESFTMDGTTSNWLTSTRQQSTYMTEVDGIAVRSGNQYSGGPAWLKKTRKWRMTLSYSRSVDPLNPPSNVRDTRVDTTYDALGRPQLVQSTGFLDVAGDESCQARGYITSSTLPSITGVAPNQVVHPGWMNLVAQTNTWAQLGTQPDHSQPTPAGLCNATTAGQLTGLTRTFYNNEPPATHGSNIPNIPASQSMTATSKPTVTATLVRTQTASPDVIGNWQINQIVYDGAGRVVATIDPNRSVAGIGAAATFVSPGQTPLSPRTTYAYDATWGYQSSATYPTVNSIAMTVSTSLRAQDGQPNWTKDQNDLVSNYCYDSLFRLTKGFLPRLDGNPRYQPCAGTTGTEVPNVEYIYSDGTYTGDRLAHQVTTLSKTPFIVVTSSLQSGTDISSDIRIESADYIDGFGRTRETQTASITPNTTLVTATLFDPRGLAVTGIETFAIADPPPSSSSSTTGAGDRTSPTGAQSNGFATWPALPTTPTLNTNTTTIDTYGRTTRNERFYGTTSLVATNIEYSGQTTITKPQLGSWTSTTVDALGRTITSATYNGTTAPTKGLNYPTNNGAITDYTYSYEQTAGHAEAGWLTVTASDDASNVSSTLTNMAGQTIKTVDPNAGATTVAYDANGNTTSTTTKPTSATENLVCTSYDILNRPTLRWSKSGCAAPSATENALKLASWTYDYPAGSSGALGFRGMPVRESSWQGGFEYATEITEYTKRYQIARSETQIPTGAGQPAAFEGEWRYQMTVDEAGHTIQVKTPIDKVPYVATGGGTQSADPLFDTINTNYNGFGLADQLSGSTYHGATSVPTNYVTGSIFDTLGRPTMRYMSATGSTNEAAFVRQYAYDTPTGALNRIQAGWDPTPSDLTGIQNWQDDQIARDAIGRITTITDLGKEPGGAFSDNKECFIYDNWNRLVRAHSARTSTTTGCLTLTSATYANTNDRGTAAIAYDRTWTFDDINRIRSMANKYTNVTSDYTYNGTGTKHAVTATTNPTASYTYNDIGSMTTHAGNTLTWDKQNRLTQYGTTNTTNIYTTTNQRLIRKQAGVFTLYLPGLEITVNGANTTKTIYRTLNGTTIATETGYGTTSRATYWDCGNHHNSTTCQTPKATTLNPAIPARKRYLPYGQPRDTTTYTTTDHNYLGQPKDTNNLIYLNNRYHDPTIGSFISVDPLVSITGMPYLYGNGNPTTLADPSGLDPCPKSGCPSNGEHYNYCEHYYSMGFDCLFNFAETDRYAYQVMQDYTKTIEKATNAWLDADGPGTYYFKGNPWRDVFRPLATVGLSFVPGVGEAWDMWDCFHGDKLACASIVIPGSLAAGSRIANAADAGHDLSRATNKADDLIGAVCSFSGDTKVLMADGTTKPISEIEVGDEVLAYDPESGERGSRKVTHLWVHEDLMLELELGRARVVTTEDHPFWSVTDQAWRQAEDLDVGDQVLSAEGRTVVVGGLDLSTTFSGTAYNLTVDDIHTYFVQVGTSEVLVHNTRCDFALKVDKNTGSLILAGPMVDPSVIRGMSRGDLVELQEMLEISVANRIADQVSGVFEAVDPAHTARIADEERLLSQVNDLLGG